jgi:hypothetical protein
MGIPLFFPNPDSETVISPLVRTGLGLNPHTICYNKEMQATWGLKQ